MSPTRWFLIAFVCFAPLHVAAIALDQWFVQPPKPIGDGPDYEVIGFNVSRGHGWTNSFADPEWRSPYQAATQLDYSVQFDRNTPEVPDTNRPPLLPLGIAAVYSVVPRGPIAFATVRVALAICLSLGCALAVGWGAAIASKSQVANPNALALLVAVITIGIVYSERNLRNYATDFLTEPVALLLTQAFLCVAWLGAHKGHRRWAIAAGIVFAGMYYCRAVFVLWIPFVAPWLMYLYWTSPSDSKNERLGATRWVAWFAITLCLACSIWWVRNCCILGWQSPLGTKGSVTMLGGYCDAALENGGEWQSAPERNMRVELESQLPANVDASGVLELEKELGRKAGQEIKRWTAANIAQLPSLFVSRVVTEWNPYSGKALLLKLAALAGVLWLMRFNRTALLWLAGPLLINTVLVMLTYSVGGRFLVPTYGALYVLAAFGIAGPLSQIRLRKHD